MSRTANWMLSFGLLGWAFFTFITPFFIKALFTPPVSFGTNCEPAADWSMNKLITTQVVGVVLFMVIGLVGSVYYRKRPVKDAAGSQPH